MVRKQTYYQVIIPNWESSFQKSSSTRPKFWLWKDRDKLPNKYKNLVYRHPKIIKNKEYCASPDGELFIKNTKKVGTPNIWVINGQQLYSGMMHPLIRSKITKYFHNYFATYIKAQLPLDISKEGLLSISCDIYEVKRPHIPDIDNLWPIIKWFQDALQETKRIPEDSPDFVIESGRKKYHWVTNDAERKLVFTIKVV